jgi:hypothetical protein
VRWADVLFLIIVALWLWMVWTLVKILEIISKKKGR